MAMSIEQQRALAAMRMRKRAADAGQIVSRGMLLPVSKTAGGEHVFDSDAGILGAAKRAFSLPEEVYRGQVDPMSPQGIERGVEFAGMFTPAGAAARAGERAIPGVAKALTREAVPVPTLEELKAAAKAGYQQVRDSGVDYQSDAVVNTSKAIQAALEQEGFFDFNSPKTFKLLERLQASPDEPSVVPISMLDGARKGLNKARNDFANGEEQEAARRAVGGLDQFIEAADPRTVVRGDAKAAGAALVEARANHAARKRSETLQGIERRGDIKAAVANSGQNLDNATRQRLGALLTNEKQLAGFDAAEREGIERVARGSPTANGARWVGNFLGGGGGLGAQASGAIGAGIGGAVGGWPGAALGGVIPPTVGAVSKKIASKATVEGLRDVDLKTRMRSPEYRRAFANAALVSKNPEQRDAMLRFLMATAPKDAPEKKR